MDGNSLTNKLAMLIQESVGTSGLLDPRSTYDYLNEAAIEVAKRTRCFTPGLTITTVANQRAYTLPEDYLGLFVQDTFNREALKYTTSTGAVSWMLFRPYQDTYFQASTTSNAVPYTFSLKAADSLVSPVTGTATSDGTVEYGESPLADSTAPFSNVSVRDEVHNLTDGSDGVVLAVNSDSSLTVAMFGGINGYFTTGDSYVVVPSQRWEIYLDPPPANSGDSITIPYYAKPTPVYSPYKTFTLDQAWEAPLVKYAAWLYKYRDGDPQFGDAFYRYFEMSTRKAVSDSKRGLNRYSMRVNKTKRSYQDRSYR